MDDQYHEDDEEIEAEPGEPPVEELRFSAAEEDLLEEDLDPADLISSGDISAVPVQFRRDKRDVS